MAWSSLHAYPCALTDEVPLKHPCTIDSEREDYGRSSVWGFAGGISADIALPGMWGVRHVSRGSLLDVRAARREFVCTQEGGGQTPSLGVSLPFSSVVFDHQRS